MALLAIKKIDSPFSQFDLSGVTEVGKCYMLKLSFDDQMNVGSINNTRLVIHDCVDLCASLCMHRTAHCYNLDADALLYKCEHELKDIESTARQISIAEVEQVDETVPVTLYADPIELKGVMFKLDDGKYKTVLLSAPTILMPRQQISAESWRDLGWKAPAFRSYIKTSTKFVPVITPIDCCDHIEFLSFQEPLFDTKPLRLRGEAAPPP